METRKEIIKQMGDEMREDIFLEVNNRIERSLRRRFWLRISAVAASVTLLFGISNYISFHEGYKKLNSQMIEMVNPMGMRSSVVLSDGTKVILNAGTTLSYPAAFVSGQREVKVNGEAFFEVSHDKEHPFIVSAENVKVKVLGTKFNVKAYDDDDDKVGVTRFFMALISLAFAVYMVPGLWGAPLKAVSAFAPPMQTQDFNLYKNEVHAKFDDYDLGMEYARLNGKPVMLDFTGYGCVNCRKMEAAVWTDPKVSDLINNDYVLITLYVDNKTPLTEPVKIIENGTERTLRTVGDKWSYLQRVKFGANAQPFYVLLDNQGKPLNKSYAYNEDIPKYIEFLQTGLENYKKGKN